MSRSLNHWGRMVFRAVAARGEGVLETFVAILREMLQTIAVKYNLKEKGLDPASVPGLVEDAFASLLAQSGAVVPQGRASARIVVAHAAGADSAASLQATPDTGQVSEELLHRAIRSNVELAEALAGVVREVNKGLATILTGAEQVSVLTDPGSRAAALAGVQREAERLQRVMQGLGNAGPTPAPALPRPVPPPAARPGPVRPAASEPPAAAMPRPVPTPVLAPVPAPASVPRPAPTLEATLRDALALARSALDSRGVKLEVRVAPGSLHPRCPAPEVSRIVAALLLGASAVSPAGSAAVLRCERKPVLLRARDGGEARRDFLMLALAHGGGLPPEQQQQAMQGNPTGPLGEAGRLARELGGFIRFAPLPGGGLESRLFLPAA
jgi:hypothetical protein